MKNSWKIETIIYDTVYKAYKSFSETIKRKS